ncbi:L-threonylcarbamoyladenylate synthase [Erythrobacteraceae bacterium WH01K]|nr:L-threonylcarbamoyladenylate synthase [Erythrobacteraceae bacterium WH01K]
MNGKNATERLAAESDGIARAASLLCAGRIVAVPTETVYGLAARADDAQAVARVFEAKGRPSFNPLIVHTPDMAMAEGLADLDERARLLARTFWPGPLTLVVPARDGAPLAPAVTAGLPTVALRCPAHPVMRQVLEATGHALAAPSANRSETVSPTCARHVLSTLDGRIDGIIDGGESRQGLESTIVALEPSGGWSILRPGPVTADEVAAVLGSPPVDAGDGIRAPGQLARHYAPGKPVRLDAAEARKDEFLLGFGETAGDWSLSPTGDLAEAAARLYAGLHRAAEAPHARIAVATVPDAGLGAAINDRLRRASA